jgi:hypothetical protein
MLFLFTKSFKYMVRTNFHNVNFFLETSFWIRFFFALMVLTYLSGTTAWNWHRLQDHKCTFSSVFDLLATTLIS